MVDGARQLAAILSAAPSSFKPEMRVFAGEGHISYYPLLIQAAFIGFCHRLAPTEGQLPWRKRLYNASSVSTSWPIAASSPSRFRQRKRSCKSLACQAKVSCWRNLHGDSSCLEAITWR